MHAPQILLQRAFDRGFNDRRHELETLRVGVEAIV